MSPMSTESEAVRERPILVGGTGRSGSTIVGHLLDHHRALALTRPMEVRFLAGRFGLADALHAQRIDPSSGPAAAQLAAQRIHDRWYHRAEDVGLHTSIAREELTNMTDTYLAQFPIDALMATRELARVIMARVAPGPARWVDTTPANSRQADRMESIYPQAQVVTVLRDGRDVAASFVQQSFGPDDVFVALQQWERRMLRIHVATMAARPSGVLTVDLMDLVSRDRASSVQAICDFLEVDLDPQMLEWFDHNVVATSAHPGRWRSQFDEETARAVDRAYAEAVDRLSARGVHIPSE